MYLQPIFESDDINRQLPAEGKRFAGVDRLWRKTLTRVGNAPHVLSFCDDADLLEQWTKARRRARALWVTPQTPHPNPHTRIPRSTQANAELERVQKNLADYLETKRTAFARFYFLSNDELIEILSQTKDPSAVQPHLRKCFEAVQQITMSGAEHEMSEMVSAEKEQVPFLNPLYPRGSVEVWMGEIETMMRRARCATRDHRGIDNSTRPPSAATLCSATRRWWCSR